MAPTTTQTARASACLLWASQEEELASLRKRLSRWAVLAVSVLEKDTEVASFADTLQPVSTHTWIRERFCHFRLSLRGGTRHYVSFCQFSADIRSWTLTWPVQVSHTHTRKVSVHLLKDRCFSRLCPFFKNTPCYWVQLDCLSSILGVLN